MPNWSWAWWWWDSTRSQCCAPWSSFCHSSDFPEMIHSYGWFFPPPLLVVILAVDTSWHSWWLYRFRFPNPSKSWALFEFWSLLTQTPLVGQWKKTRDLWCLCGKPCTQISLKSVDTSKIVCLTKRDGNSELDSKSGCKLCKSLQACCQGKLCLQITSKLVITYERKARHGSQWTKEGHLHGLAFNLLWAI